MAKYSNLGGLTKSTLAPKKSPMAKLGGANKLVGGIMKGGKLGGGLQGTTLGKPPARVAPRRPLGGGAKKKPY